MKTASPDPIGRTAAFIEQKFRGEGSGHDWEHIRRVWQAARHLARTQSTADPLVTELAALLHDVADWKFHNGDLEAGPRAARAWLLELGLPPEVIGRVEQVIREVSFKGKGVPTPVSSSEAACVQDADRLDAIGAIGIARAFAYGGHQGRPLHDSATPPEDHADFAAYQRAHSGTINHFYEKLLHLRDRMHTAEGRRLAEERHQVLEAFLQQFLREWDEWGDE